MPRASADARAAAGELDSRARSRVAQIRHTFIAKPGPHEPSPLNTLLRGGRGGQVRLKTYLSLLWLSAAQPHDSTYPSRSWATLLDLDDPAGLGARRINDAMKWLEAHHFITIEARPGHPNRVTLLQESGNGDTYSVPGEETRALKEKGRARVGDPDFDKHRYIQIPPTFWTSGWLAVLTAPAIAMYLVLLAEQGPNEAGIELWLSPRLANERYGMSSDTRTAGLDELRRAGLITVRRKAVASGIFDVVRYRNVHTLVPEKLKEPGFVPDRVASDHAEMDKNHALAATSSHGATNETNKGPSDRAV